MQKFPRIVIHVVTDSAPPEASESVVHISVVVLVLPELQLLTVLVALPDDLPCQPNSRRFVYYPCVAPVFLPGLILRSWIGCFSL